MKTARYILVACMALLVVSIFGCTVPNDEIKKAMEVCEPNEGLSHIVVMGTGPTVDTLVCNNGAEFRYEN